jgi:pyruvate dehydrogenase E2 component (dihydrolipoamide acetyltransferase)
MPEQILMPRLSQTMETGRVVEWLKHEGDPVHKGDPLVTIETDKATSDLEAPATGTLFAISVAEGEEVPAGTLLAVMALDGDDPHMLRGAQTFAHMPASKAGGHEAVNSQMKRPVSEELPTVAGRKPVSPAARRLAIKLGVDLAQASGTGAGGLVTASDVQRLAAVTPPAQGETVIPLTGLRGRIAERLSRSRHTAADVTTVMDVDVTDIPHTEDGSAISYTGVVVWAAAKALLDFPVLNAWLVDDKIFVKNQRDIGVAVAIPDGLIVPVVRSADAKSMTEITQELDLFAESARAGQLSPSQVSDATFTVTNSGAFGSLFFTPIINQPEIAILGMGHVSETPVVRHGEIVIRKIMYLCLSYDHRAVDGATAVQFLKRVKEHVEGIPN